jgi:hypothetical protein
MTPQRILGKVAEVWALRESKAWRAAADHLAISFICDHPAATERADLIVTYRNLCEKALAEELALKPLTKGHSSR